MKYIIEVFSVMLVLVFNLLLCISMLGVSADVAAAKEFKAAMIAEIENSDFNPYVIDGCKAAGKNRRVRTGSAVLHLRWTKRPQDCGDQSLL